MNRAAFTLTEVVLVLAVVTLALLPMMTFFRGQTFQAVQSGRIVRVHGLLLEMLVKAEVRLYEKGFKDGAFSIGPVRRKYPWGENATVEVEEALSASPSALTTGLWVLEASVTWNENRGGRSFERRRSLVRFVSDPDPACVKVVGG